MNPLCLLTSRLLRRGAAQPERRAHPRGEFRWKYGLQEREVNCEDHTSPTKQPHDTVEYRHAPKRSTASISIDEPERRSSALVAGARAVRIRLERVPEGPFRRRCFQYGYGDQVASLYAGWT